MRGSGWIQLFQTTEVDLRKISPVLKEDKFPSLKALDVSHRQLYKANEILFFFPSKLKRDLKKEKSLPPKKKVK